EANGPSPPENIGIILIDPSDILAVSFFIIANMVGDPGINGAYFFQFVPGRLNEVAGQGRQVLLQFNRRPESVPVNVPKVRLPP
ncbi:hypothetical protein RZS08_32535, partial [Arthrospira platensis SPKY1]|nr:hypothetical protein [Arthrospira platensis SPKY1]